MAYIQRNSPLKDAKFLTSLQPKATNPKELIKMTPEQRSEARKSLSDAVATGLTLNPAVGGATKAVKGTVTGVRALATGGLGRAVRSNARSLWTFIGQKLGLKGGTEATQQIGRM